VRPDINILLTTYELPFWKDHILPLGTLREFVSGKERANIIVVTKCPENLTSKEYAELVAHIQPTEKQKVFFAKNEYGNAYNLMNPNDRLFFMKADAQLLITGIANAGPLKKYIEERASEVVHFEYDDHHFFEEYELASIKKNYPEFKHWVTTEKDGVRLALHRDWFIANNISLYCLPVKTKITGPDSGSFGSTITGYLHYFYEEDNSLSSQ
jgi:tetraacyldisaccharide 4'-kinase